MKILLLWKTKGFIAYLIGLLLFVFFLTGSLMFSGSVLAELQNSNTSASVAAVLPVNELSERSLTGMLLVAFGIGLLVAEFFILGGLLALSGFLAFILGIILLFHAEVISLELALAFSLGMAAITAAFLLLALNLGLRARARPVVSGREELMNSIGEIASVRKDQTLMRLRGELWGVTSKHPLTVGKKVKVIGINGLILEVQPVKDSSQVDN